MNTKKSISNIKFIALALLASAFAVSCSNDETEDIVTSKVPMQFSGVQEQITTTGAAGAKGTRTTLQADGFSVDWLANDSIAIFPEGVTTPDKFIAKTGGQVSLFTGVTTTATTYRALFPYDKHATCENGVFKTILRPFQTVEDNNMDNSASLAVATLTNANPSLKDNRLNFKNACGMLKVTFKYAADLAPEERKKVYSIEVVSRENKGISGYVNIGADGKCVAQEFGHASISVGKENNEELTEGAAYYIVMPAQTVNGIVVYVYGENGAYYSVTVKKPINFERNHIQKLNLVVKRWDFSMAV